MLLFGEPSRGHRAASDGSVGGRVLLARQPADGPHDIVGERPQHDRVIRSVTVGAEVQRGADPDLDPGPAGDRLTDRQHLVGSDHRHRHDRHLSQQRHSYNARLAPVEPPVGRPAALRVDTQQPAAPKDAHPGGERGGRRIGVAPVDGEQPRTAHERRLRPALDPASREVLGLGQERHPPAGQDRQEQRVAHRQVVARQERAASSRDAVGTHHARAEQRPEQRAQRVLDEPVEHAQPYARVGPTVPAVVSTCTRSRRSSVPNSRSVRTWSTLTVTRS